MITSASPHENGLRTSSRRRLAMAALCLLLPAASFGAWIGLWQMPGQWLGRAGYLASKVWVVLVPITWRVWVDRQPLSLSPLKRGGVFVGGVLGFAMAGAILAAYLTIGPRLLDPAAFAQMGKVNGLSAWPVYLGAALYWIGINSMLEEMVWRWFVVERFEDIGLGPGAAGCSALGFTLHHIVALRVYCSWELTFLCAVGIFIGGAVWSALFRRYRSIWPGYVSHAVVDVCVFILGWRLIHGG